MVAISDGGTGNCRLCAFSESEFNCFDDFELNHGSGVLPNTATIVGNNYYYGGGCRPRNRLSITFPPSKLY